MKVKILKRHRAYENIFKAGEVVEFTPPNTIISNVNGNKYDANELCKCFSNTCALSDVIKKVSVYIDFLNKEKDFKKDKIYFESYEDAKKWAFENLEKFHPDFINYL